MLKNKKMWSEVKKHFAEFENITQAKIVGLAEHLDIDIEDVGDIDITDDECTFEIHGGEWLVCTDEEADRKCADEIREMVWAFNTSFLLGFVPRYITESMLDACKEKCEDANDDVLQLIEAGEGMENFVDSAIASDGRGGYLNLYSSDEEEIEIDNNTFYIFRRF